MPYRLPPIWDKGSLILKSKKNDSSPPESSKISQSFSSLDLTHAKILGRGNERICYLHPFDPSKVVKISFPQKGRDQNHIDLIYSKFLTSVGADCAPTCYGIIQTNLGEGLVCERIVNYDGSSSLTLQESVDKEEISHGTLQHYLKALKKRIYADQIIIADISPANILFQRLSPKKSRLIIIDGLGGRHLGFKFWCYQKLFPLRWYKVRKQWWRMKRQFKDAGLLNPGQK